jgi:phospholipid transport system substrate-binding protein
MSGHLMINGGLARQWQIKRRHMVQLTLVATCFTSLQAPPSAAVEAPDAATELVTALNARLLAGMKAGRTLPFATRYGQLAPLIERSFDLPDILEAAVGPQWVALTSEDHASLLNAFSRYTISSYVTNFSNYGGERIDVLPDVRRVGEQVVVATRIVPLSGKPAQLDYVLSLVPGESGTRWKVIDVMLGGSISQVAVLRSEFHGLLRDGSATRLIAVLNGKTADLSGSSLGAPSEKNSIGPIK